MKVHSVERHCWLLVVVSAASLAPHGLSQTPARSPSVVTFPDPGTKAGHHCWEPHVAVDPADPTRVVLSAMFRGVNGKGDDAQGVCTLFAWHSHDGGRSWSEPVAPFVRPGRPDGRIGADSVVAYGAGGSTWIAGCDYDFPVMGRPGYSSIKACASSDRGKTWTPPVTLTELDNKMTGDGVVDKPWIAIDPTGGPLKGTAYVAWTRLDYGSKPNRAELWCAALRPVGGRATPAVRLGEPIDLKQTSSAVHHVQLAVRPDGTLDVVWRVAPTDRLLHAFSTDGAKTFSKPVPVSDDETGAGRYPSLCPTPDGGLLAAWTNQRGVVGATLAAGKWSPPQLVAGELPQGVALTHPAVAATSDALWTLTFRRETTPRRTSLVLYRSADRGVTWAEHLVLATRGAAVRVMSPGDYIGLTGTKDSLYATYVLPGEGPDGPRPRLYFATVSSGPPK